MSLIIKSLIFFKKDLSNKFRINSKKIKLGQMQLGLCRGLCRGLCGVFFGLLFLSGCSEKVTPNFLRDREFDYKRNNVVQPAELTIPKGVDAPNSNPKYTLSKGTDSYPPAEDYKVLPSPNLLTPSLLKDEKK